MNKGDSILLFSGCTSQFETVFNFVTSRHQPHETIVMIAPDDVFKKNTYINCNSPEPVSYNDFKKLYEAGKITYKGELSDEYYDAIVKGLKMSRLVEKNVKKLFLD